VTRRLVARLSAVGVVLVLLVASALVEEVRTLLFGWVEFLWRVVPQVAPDWPSVAVGVGAFALFGGGVHLFARARWPGWKLRRTATVVVGCVVLFAAGVAVVGIAHQVGWLASSGRPLREESVARWWTTREGNAREFGIGASNYEGANGHLPPGGSFTDNGEMLHSWETHLLPYLNYSARDIDLKQPWNAPANAEYFRRIHPDFINPGFRTPPLTDADGYGLSHYAANVRVAGANRGMKLTEITDGTGNTILFGEVNAGFRPWGHPVNWRDPAAGIGRSPAQFGGPPGTSSVLFVMADGSVRAVSNRASAATLKALATPNAGDAGDE
jgi:hypothetical protein